MFPFQKLRYYTFVTLDVFNFVEHPKAYEFLFAVNKATRTYLENNFIIIRNGFINEGLIDNLIDVSNDDKRGPEQYYY